jgi:hypothetical protein
MDLIRIPLVNLAAAADGARLMGLQIDQVCGDADARYINIGARQAGPRGDREPRWTPMQRAAMARLLAHEAPVSLTLESRCGDEVAYFANGGMTTEELHQYARRTTRHPLLCLGIIVMAPFVIEGLCRLLGV